MAYSRRSFLQHSGIGLLTFCIGGCEVELTPEEAREQRVPFRVLSENEATTLEALGEVLVPGSAAAGLAHFVDHQLAAPPGQQLLMLKYLGVDPPFAPFYQGGLAGLDAAARAMGEQPFTALQATQRVALVRQFSTGQPEGWSGPPAPFFYFVARNDAVDVVYGTKEGIESLGIPYMAHIEPPSRWGG